MSYTKDYVHDVFISYASVDSGPNRWMETFHALLKGRLESQGLQGELSIFFDQTRIESGARLEGQIRTAAASSAVMLAMHSLAFDKAEEWCRRELREFRDSHGNLEGRLFVAALDGDNPPTASEAFAGELRHFHSFFTQVDSDYFLFDPRRPNELNAEHHTFDQEVDLLARGIAKYLRKLRANTTAQRVYIMASAAFTSQVQDIRNTLNAGQYIVTQSWPWTERDNSLEDARTMIAQADLVINIEESFADPSAAAIGKYARAQAQFADGPPARPRLRWLPNENHGFTAEQLARLKKTPGVVSTELQEFKGLVIKRLESLKSALMPADVVVPPAPVAGPPRFALVIYAPVDATHSIDHLLRIDAVSVGRVGLVDPVLSTDLTDREIWRQRMSEYVKKLAFTSILLVDGKCPREWIDTRVQDCLMLLSDLAIPMNAAVWDCPPAPKEDGIRLCRPLGRVTFLTCHDDPALRDFLLAP